MRATATPRNLMAAAILVCAVVAPEPLHAEGAYRIGALFPMSGPLAVFGDIFRAASDLALEHVRADGRLGRPLEIQYEDSQGQIQPTLIGMNKLARSDHVP